MLRRTLTDVNRRLIFPGTPGGPSPRSFTGIFTGVFAYYLHENHPRTAPPPDQRLLALLQWKREKYQRERIEKLLALEVAEQWPPAELTK